MLTPPDEVNRDWSTVCLMSDGLFQQWTEICPMYELKGFTDLGKLSSLWHCLNEVDQPFAQSLPSFGINSYDGKVTFHPLCSNSWIQSLIPDTSCKGSLECCKTSRDYIIIMISLLLALPLIRINFNCYQFCLAMWLIPSRIFRMPQISMWVHYLGARTVGNLRGNT